MNVDSAASKGGGRPEGTPVEGPYDFVVVGSGAGGGPLAANLARAGFTVLLLEAGGDAGDRLTYQVPAFHGWATEDEAMRWDYYVRHYADEKQQERDSKYCPARGGVWYPRAAALGGCTAHHALITVTPHNSDWNAIAELTGDASWHSDSMRRYWERLERCEYVPAPGAYPPTPLRALLMGLLRFLGWLPRHETANPGRRGFRGWLATNIPDLRLALADRQLVGVIKAAAVEGLAGGLDSPGHLLRNLLAGIKEYVLRGTSPFSGAIRQLDLIDWQEAQESPEGLVLTPLTTTGGRRRGPREYILETQREFPTNLIVRTHALVTRVLLDDTNRATGVEYVPRPHLYRADPHAEPDGSELGSPRVATAAREVILCAGAFNSPQLLKLSGIGPREELERFNICVRVELPGVGENLQDRYEVGVISDMKDSFAAFDEGTFRPPHPGEKPDRALQAWMSGRGVYTSNGVAIGVIKRSRKERRDPDLFIFGLPGSFRGYFHGYPDEYTRRKDAFTWIVLKAHTENRAGTVRLRSADPRDTPKINFHYFHEGSDTQGKDLDSIVQGVDFVRQVTERAHVLTTARILPNESIDTVDELQEFIKKEAWGHHASCSNPIGPASDRKAVVDGNFRVHGVRNLRVVDASVFPRIPGFFILTAIYMISEKAADVIIADARSSGGGR